MSKTVEPHKYAGRTLWGAWRYKVTSEDEARVHMFESEYDAREYLSNNGGGEYKQIGAQEFMHIYAGDTP
jgi:hypothetical protein